MTPIDLQMLGLRNLSYLAAGLQAMIVAMFAIAVGHVTPDGKVPVLDAGILTALLLSYQQTVSAVRSIWESQERSVLTDKLAASTPVAPPATEEPLPGAPAGS